MRVTIPRRFQGIAGMAQGGHAAGVFAAALGGPVVISFRSPCPLETPLDVIADGDRHVLADGDRMIMEAESGQVEVEPPAPVTPDEAAAGREWAERRPIGSNISTCFSCGDSSHSFRVHAGKVPGADVYATPLVHPEWTAPDGVVEDRFLWAPIDCAAGWRVSIGDDGRPAVTGRLAVRVERRVRAGEPLVVVAQADGPWRGRKRSARSAIYTHGGELVAASESLWIALP